MTVDRGALEELTREALLAEARRVSVRKADVMTRVELIDEIVRLGTPNPVERKKARGWLGVARDLVAEMVDKGLNLPDAAAFIRGDVRYEPLRSPQRPVATVTLAEIYGAQGHFTRALGILDEVLANEPDHHVAQALRSRLARERDERRGDAPKIAPDPVVEPPFVEEPAPIEPPIATPDAPEEPPGVEEPPPIEPPPVIEPPRSLESLLPVEDPVTLPPPAPTPPPAERLFDDPSGPAAADPRTIPPRAAPDAIAPVPDSTTTAVSNAPPESEPPTAVQPRKTPNGVSPRAPADAVVLVRRDGAPLAAYYERRGEPREDALVVLRVVEMRPRPSGTVRVERDFTTVGPHGVFPVEGVEPGSVVRAALGTVRGERFEAFAVGAEVNLGGNGPEITWSPHAASTSLAAVGAAVSSLPHARG